MYLPLWKMPVMQGWTLTNFEGEGVLPPPFSIYYLPSTCEAHCFSDGLSLKFKKVEIKALAPLSLPTL